VQSRDSALFRLRLGHNFGFEIGCEFCQLIGHAAQRFGGLQASSGAYFALDYFAQALYFAIELAADIFEFRHPQNLFPAMLSAI
jgi:hypothetical protein